MVRRAIPDSLFNPRRFRSVLHDSQQVRGFEVDRRVTISYECPSTRPDVSFVCVLRPAKGRTLRGIEVRGRTGSQCRVLSRAESRALAAASLHQTFCTLLAVDPRVQSAWAPAVRAAHLRMLQLVTEEEAASSVSQRQRIEARAEEMMLAALNNVSGAEHAVESSGVAFAQAVGVAAARDFLVVEVPGEDAGVLTYQQTDLMASVTQPATGASRAKRIKRAVALALGGVPNEIAFNFYKVAKAAEYHLDVNFDASNVIEEAQVVPPPTSSFVLVRGAGTSQAHVGVMRPDDVLEGARLEVVVRERPEESLLRAALLSLVIAAGVIAMGVVSAHGSGTSTTALELLSGLVGVLSLGAVAVWAVVGRTLLGRAVALPAVLSAVVSAALLVIALATFAGVLTPWATELSWWGLSSGATLAALLCVGHFLHRVVKLKRLRDQEASINLEAPAV